MNKTEFEEKYPDLKLKPVKRATYFPDKKIKKVNLTRYHNVMKKVDIFTSTLGKALGGASGGFTTGRKDIIEVLRQKSRPYLFSNT